jgi:parallel beta-helix repeat protein
VSIAIFFAGNNILSNNYMTDQISWLNTGPPDFPFQKSGAVFMMVNSGDIIKANTFVNNEVAISLDNQADNCLIYNNNFINNTQQALVGRAVTRIAWDNGYPCSGNYWSDYNGTDSFNGAYQNKTGSDGIGDTPYIIDASNIDHYPLMKPWAAHILGDVNGDGTVDLKDLVLLACAYGSTPGCTNWDANADLDGNGRVSLTDLVTLATHYGQHYP